MFSGMVLVLTVGAVCALLYRQVLLPIKRLVDFTESPADDIVNDDFYEASEEIAHLAKAFQEMADRVRELEGQQKASASDDTSPETLP